MNQASGIREIMRPFLYYPKLMLRLVKSSPPRTHALNYAPLSICEQPWSRNMTLTATCADFNTFACSVYPIWPLHPKLTGVEAVISKSMATCQATSACMYDRSLRLLGKATTAQSSIQQPHHFSESGHATVRPQVEMLSLPYGHRHFTVV